jgi:hypothetical protein
VLHGPFYQFAGIGKGWHMEPKKPLNQFQEVHEKVRERLDRAHKLKEKDVVLQRKKAEEEAVREGFDRAQATN